jgi:hypothetical protein
MMNHRVLVFLVLLLSFLPGVAFSDRDTGFDADFDKEPWKEVEVRLPSFPEKENLIPFTISSSTDMRFFIDEKSISVGSDDVIRYSLVVVGPSGAQNVSFEGMRCATAERRVYAFGQTDKTWLKARKDQWVRILGSGNSFPVVLFSNYLCVIGERAVTTPEEAVRALREGAARNSGS